MAIGAISNRRSSLRVAVDLLACQQRVGLAGRRQPVRRRQIARAAPDSASSHWRYGRRAAMPSLISSSPTMRPVLGVDQEHAAGLQAILVQHVVGRDVEHADLGGHDHEAVLGHDVARRAQAVAIEHARR